MGIMASDNGGDFEPVPAGMHRATCVNVFDVGYQPGYQGAPPAHKVVVLWEIEPLNSQHKHFTVTRIYTLSIGDKSNLGNDLTTWRGRPFTAEERRGFDLDNIIGKPCQLNLVQNGDKVKIAGVMPATMIPDATTRKNVPAGYWTIETKRDYIPNFVKKMLESQIAPPSKAKAPQPAAAGAAPGDDFTDDIPF
jgi:hypothetical protein